MTVPGPYAPPLDDAKARSRRRLVTVGGFAWAFIPLLTCGFGAPVAFAIAVGRRRDTMTIVGLVLYSAILLAGCGSIGAYDYEETPKWATVAFNTAISLTALGATAHLLLIRSLVWAPIAPAAAPVPVARLSNEEVLDRARRLRAQARRTAEADPMLAKRLGVGRPDLPRQFDDGGLVDLNHAPMRVLVTLPGVTERSARQILDRVAGTGPFASLGEVMLVVEISPSFEHHLREYCVFIP